jgi:hypothetical protein
MYQGDTPTLKQHQGSMLDTPSLSIHPSINQRFQALKIVLPQECDIKNFKAGKFD